MHAVHLDSDKFNSTVYRYLIVLYLTIYPLIITVK